MSDQMTRLKSCSSTSESEQDRDCVWAADRIEQLESEVSDLQFDKAHLLCAMNSIARSTCCDKCNEAKMVAVKCIEDLAALESECANSICPHIARDVGGVCVLCGDSSQRKCPCVVDDPFVCGSADNPCECICHGL